MRRNITSSHTLHHRAVVYILLLWENHHLINLSHTMHRTVSKVKLNYRSTHHDCSSFAQNFTRNIKFETAIATSGRSTDEGKYYDNHVHIALSRLFFRQQLFRVLPSQQMEKHRLLWFPHAVKSNHSSRFS